MKIRNFSDVEKLQTGDWIEDGNGILEIIEPYSAQGYARYAEVIFDEDEDGNPMETYTLSDHHGMLTARELMHYEKI